MPIYEYRCDDCGESFEKFVRSMSRAFQVECPECHSKNCKKSISLFGSSGAVGGTSADAACAPSG